MKILVLDDILPGATTEKIQAHLKDELMAAIEHYLAGSLREWYFRLDQPGAVLMLECASVEEAQAQMDALPLARAGLAKFRCIPLGPFRPLGMALEALAKQG